MASGEVNAARARARVGERHGRLVLVEWLRSDKHRRAWFKCLCDCGATCERSSLVLNEKASCGCWGRERVVAAKTVHGGSSRHGRSPLYNCWCSIKRRCYNPRNHDFKWYGGKGVKLCQRWHDYAAFESDMGPTWFVGATIDRIDAAVNYEPGNCRWLSRAENARRAALARVWK